MLTSDVATFLQGGQCIHLGTRSETLEPTGVVVVAVSVDSDRSHLTAFLPKVGSSEVLANLEANGRAALCFARPVDDHACQVKGTYVEARPATKKERAVVEAQWDQSLRQLEHIGMPRQLWSGYAVWPCVAVRVRVTEVFDQTPGPGAGAPLA
ncbi:MAG: hypothetical protein HOP16_02970 [Acidobacteria bacterium]|nr:hypothetical protein [Acidobacteriota bacterium]